MRSHRVPARLAWLLAPLLLLTGGCSRDRIQLPVVVNLRPVVDLTYAPASTTVPSYYACELYWTGSDLDGRVEHFLYCLDPPTQAGADTPWVRTTGNRVSYVLRCDNPDPPGTMSQPVSYHVFVLKAVDNLGACSAPVVNAFTSFTLAPTVTIFDPPSRSGLLWPTLPPNAAFWFTGTDADGRTTNRPVKYKYKLIRDGGTEVDFRSVILQPDLLRKLYAPAFAGWDSISGDTCRVQVHSMIPGSEYLFAVVAIDEAGAYSPVFSLPGNLFRFACGYAGAGGPRMTVWNEYFSYGYLSGGYNPDPARAIQIEVPGGRSIDFNWSAVPLPGATMRSYRWVIDITSLDDETPRSDEGSDWSHWSRPSIGATSTIVGPFTGTGLDSLEQHTLYIEAEDSNLMKSLAMVRFRVSRPSFGKDLLFVNDTRFWPDVAPRLRPDSLIAPGGMWPSAAELDTFLYARGGVRWRYYSPATVKSTPGIFSGYAFDTLGTRRFGALGGIPLSLLGNYRHIVWMCDPAFDFNDGVIYPKWPMPLLRWMSSGTSNMLSVYSHMGGSLWLMGGGIAFNTLKPFNVPSNDLGGSGWVFSSAAGELMTGRLMYDLPHWRSEIALRRPTGAAVNLQLRANWPGAPDYSRLRVRLDPRTADPLPPLRNSAQFYVTSYAGEVLTRINDILENVSTDPDRNSLGSALDTLYWAIGGDTGYHQAVMTYYHGRETGPVVFSGFPLWYFQRSHALELGDFVLQNIWRLPREPLPR